MDFMNNISKGEVGEREHAQFVRFSKGKFDGRAALSLQRGDKIKLGGSFEYANDFCFLTSQLGEVKFSGIIMSKEDLGFPGKKKAGLFVADVAGLDTSKIKEIKERVYCMLLDGEGEGISLKMKQKLPKPGKSGELKIDDKFCILETDLKYWNQIKAFFNLPETKKAKIHHSIIVESIVLPQGEKDPEKLRLNSKRKGKIQKKITIDKVEKVETFDFEA